jgi:hypothetical protein
MSCLEAEHNTDRITFPTLLNPSRPFGSDLSNWLPGGPFNENPKHTLAFEYEHEHSPDTTVDDASINGNAAESRPRSSFSEGHTPSYRSVDTEEQGGGG